MEKVISTILAICLGGLGLYTYNTHKKLGDEIERMRTSSKVAINAGVLSQVTEFTFSRITNHFTYVHKKSGLTPLPWKGIYQYSWDFEYNFGIEIPQNWVWAFKETDPGVVSIDVPPLAQLNDYNITINLTDRIEVANGAHSAQMMTEVQAIAEEKVKQVELEYLQNTSVREATKRSLEGFFLNFLNERSQGMPVRKVIINFKT